MEYTFRIKNISKTTKVKQRTTFVENNPERDNNKPIKKKSVCKCWTS